MFSVPAYLKSNYERERSPCPGPQREHTLSEGMEVLVLQAGQQTLKPGGARLAGRFVGGDSLRDGEER